MSILIKGMDMPKTCCDCNFNIAGWCTADLASERIEFPGRPDWCPLVEVPKHGRLIDADEPIDKILNGEYITMVDKYGNNWMMPGKVIEIIANAPTIIEAEE